MPNVLPVPWRLPLVTGVIATLLVVRVWTGVDLSPRVEADFFFSPSDPQLQESRAIQARYPSGELVIVRAESSDVEDAEYVDRVEALGRTLEELPGVSAVYSVANQNPSSPLWSRVLTPSDGSATNLVMQAEVDDGGDLTRRIEAALVAHQADGFGLFASGVPVIVELIRRSLRHDLLVFSTTALLAFGLIITLVYRNARVVVGTLLACLTACAATLLVTDMVGIGVGLLTANIITIVFVLTLSHTVFLTANWRKAEAGSGDLPGREDVPRAEAATRAIRSTLEPSVWCMLTTVFGFLSLLLASAEPLRELGTAGAIGTVIALVSGFTILPAWLAHGRATRGAEPEAEPPGWLAALPTPSLIPLIVLGATVALIGTGVFRLNTDPTLLSYFAEDGAIRPGLERIDAAGGSSPLLLAVGAADRGSLDTTRGYDAMWALQDSLEADPATGLVLSPAPLLAHARSLPLANLIPISVLVGFLERPEFGGIARGFILEDRTEVLYSIRMIEGARSGSRQDVIERLAAHAEPAGLTVEAVGGLYELQGRLGSLIASSLRVGLGGLLILFLFIGLWISRAVPTALAMLGCLVAIPAIVLGTFGHLGVAVDIITSPAANVALAMGVDSMIHLVNRVRRLGSGPARAGGPWIEARSELARPITAACCIIVVGFAIFALSDFPPTQRFGFAVILGTVSAAAAALIALPGLMKGTPAAST